MTKEFFFGLLGWGFLVFCFLGFFFGGGGGREICLLVVFWLGLLGFGVFLIFILYSALNS